MFIIQKDDGIHWGTVGKPSNTKEEAKKQLFELAENLGCSIKKLRIFDTSAKKIVLLNPVYYQD